ncbi:ribosome biogenesis GTP-binding protein YihA/YsxC [Pseudobdellovibrio exovorus]|uniref:Probable GTP-binding protein EngB n=1 Tax=Pseudobdellovibrio exovorus JSS TaxID=1184267 RepID=M4V913_9BACT|nr:ribosome biogenesis GTP-binding protein YihA/YsxC [Pseudobdellovibrio exovorus]AGH94940.1 GTP-binding protein [Pseudobdellovibrio exovorus JSS]
MPKMSFIKSAVKMKDFPVSPLKEVALAGRSNAGKSSLINVWAGGKVAKVSQSPGKTRLLNFFSMGDSYIIVDMPGYGYASRGGDELKTWRKMIEGYLTQRPQLAGLVLLMDMARDWTRDEELMAQFMMKNDLPVVIGLTKSDKFSKNDIKKAIERIKQQSRLEDVFAVSSQTKSGCAELEEFVYRAWIKK